VGKANGSGLRPARWQAPRAHHDRSRWARRTQVGLARLGYL